MSDIGYSGQYLDNKNFRMKVRTGSDITNITGDAVVGEMFLTTGENPAFYICGATSSDDDFEIYKVADAEGLISGGSYNKYAHSVELGRDTALRTIGLGSDHPLHFKGNNPFSISLWVKLYPVQEGQSTYFARKAGNSYTYDFQWIYNSTGTTSIIIYEGTGANNHIGTMRIDADTSSIIKFNTWHNLIFTWDGGTTPSSMNYYVDGNLQTVTTTSSGAFTQMAGVNGTWAFGQRTSPVQNTLFGKYHEIAFFDSALNATQALDIYTNKDLSSYNPLYWWNMGGATNGEVTFLGHGVNQTALYLRDVDTDDDGTTDTLTSIPYDLSFDTPHNNL